MLAQQLLTPENQDMMKDIISYLEKKGFTEIKADIEEYERPTRLLRKNSDDIFIPNITASKSNSKHYFEIVPKGKDTDGKMVSKLTTLSALAGMKGGKLCLIVPNGKLRYTNQLLEDNRQIEAEVLPMKAIQ
ncbi:hypothetical protein R9C00_27035 [Flammeovirgaceae bacterium SG7u.111]|nr:hypothetical protein [Flammeovirgaceae bacterium SG7u.132]WPO35356.1 hypothetical protein R9C00_27035 [Flammeovirgaceae bacterium SG7u.111]